MDPEVAREYLRRARLLAALPDAGLDRLATAMEWIVAAQGETVVEYLDPAESILFFLSGACRLKVHVGGRAVELRAEDVGRHFGEVAEQTDAGGALDIVALDDSMLAKCPRRALEKEHLRTVRVLAEIPEEQLDELATAVKWIKAGCGDAIVMHLQRSDSVFFIISGACKVRLFDAKGCSVAFRRLVAGQHFGEIAALTGVPRTVEVAAAADCLLAECPRPAFDRLMGASFARSIAVSLAFMVASLTERVFELAAFDVEGRLCAELLRLAKTGERVEAGVLIKDLPTQKTIAATIGSQREEVSRKLGEMEDKGLVRRGKHTLLIPDIDRLRKEVRKLAGFLWEPDAEEA